MERTLLLSVLTKFKPVLKFTTKTIVKGPLNSQKKQKEEWIVINFQL